MNDDDACEYVAAIEGLDPHAWEMYGKSAFVCTRDELNDLALDMHVRADRLKAEIAHLHADIARGLADLDQIRAAAAEVDICGCDLEMPLDELGQPDVGRARPVHTCDREAGDSC